MELYGSFVPISQILQWVNIVTELYQILDEL